MEREKRPLESRRKITVVGILIEILRWRSGSVLFSETKHFEAEKKVNSLTFLITIIYCKRTQFLSLYFFTSFCEVICVRNLLSIHSYKRETVRIISIINALKWNIKCMY